MEQKEKDLLLRTFEYARENNVILKKMRNGRRWKNIFRLLYGIIAIIGFVYLYYYLEPYVSKLIEVYKNLPIPNLP